MQRCRTVSLVAATVILAACTGGGSSASPATSAPPPPPAGVGSPQPGAQPPSISEARAVRSVFRVYLATLAAPLSAKLLRTRRGLSTGAIASWIDWQLAEPIAATPPGSLSIRRDRVRSVAGDLAWVDLEASVRFPGATDPIGGPAVARRTPSGWRVLDYSWGGRDQAQAVFANARGSQTVGSVTLTVFGVVLQANSVDVYASIENGGHQSLDLQAADAVVTSDARTLGGLTPYATGPVAPGGSQRLDFLLVGRGLPVTTTGFRLDAKMYTDPGYSVLAFDIPVILSP